MDPAQVLAVQAMMAQTSAGSWAAPTTGREMPRQNGKGDEVEVVELWGLVQRGEAILHTVHDAVLLASQTQQRMLGVLEAHADLRRLVKRKWQGTGQQMIEMRNGGVIWYRTRTGGGGRGVDDIDRLVVDEAQHATEDQLAAVAPTLLANPDPQLNALGTAGIAGQSDWWWSQRIRALSPDPGNFAYVGHTVEKVRVVDGRVVQDPVDVYDRSRWPGANPALHAGRGTGIEFFEEQLRRLGPSLFAREHLGVWDPPPVVRSAAMVVPLIEWETCRDPESRAEGPVAYGVGVSLDGAWSSVAASDGEHAEIVANRPGTSWVVDGLKERGIDRIWLNPSSPANVLVPPLERAGIQVMSVKAADYAQACATFLELVRANRFRHHGHPALDTAVQIAQRRDSGESWCWSQRRSPGDISPLVAVTLATFAGQDVFEGPLVVLT